VAPQASSRAEELLADAGTIAGVRIARAGQHLIVRARQGVIPDRLRRSDRRVG
jgi:hypothetical protein